MNDNDIALILCSYDFSDESFERIFRMLDTLHDFASEGRLPEATDLSGSEIVGWLEDMEFTISEIRREIDTHAAISRALADKFPRDNDRLVA